MQRGRLFAAGREVEAAASYPSGEDRGTQYDRRAGGLGVALIGQHQRMAVDDAGRRRQEGGGAAQRRFEAPDLGAAQPFEVVDTVRPCRRGNRFEPGDLGLVGGDDQLAEPGMRHPALMAIGIEPLAAGDTALRLEAARRVIDPAVDHLAVARRGLEPDREGALDDQHLAAGQRQRPCRGKTDQPGADDDAFDLVHPLSPPSGRECRWELMAPASGPAIAEPAAVARAVREHPWHRSTTRLDAAPEIVNTL